MNFSFDNFLLFFFSLHCQFLMDFMCFSCRFVFGGDHGKFKFSIPDGHSPAIESMLPKEKLKLEPCFWFGEIHRNVFYGPTEVEYTPYVPKPVDTANVSLSYLESTIICKNRNHILSFFVFVFFFNFNF